MLNLDLVWVSLSMKGIYQSTWDKVQIMSAKQYSTEHYISSSHRIKCKTKHKYCYLYLWNRQNSLSQVGRTKELSGVHWALWERRVLCAVCEGWEVRVWMISLLIQAGGSAFHSMVHGKIETHLKALVRFYSLYNHLLLNFWFILWEHFNIIWSLFLIPRLISSRAIELKYCHSGFRTWIWSVCQNHKANFYYDIIKSAA